MKTANKANGWKYFNCCTSHSSLPSRNPHNAYRYKLLRSPPPSPSYNFPLVCPLRLRRLEWRAYYFILCYCKAKKGHLNNLNNLLFLSSLRWWRLCLPRFICAPFCCVLLRVKRVHSLPSVLLWPKILQDVAFLNVYLKQWVRFWRYCGVYEQGVFNLLNEIDYGVF